MTILPDTIDPQTVPHGRALIFKGDMDKDTCAHIAERFSFVEVRSVAFNLNVKHISKDCWQLKGAISSTIKQSCVVTGEPVQQVIKADIYERFVSNFQENDEIDVQDSSVEPMENGLIPIKEAVIQFIGVEADPYPRKENAPDTHEFGPKIEPENPFSKLRQLKK